MDAITRENILTLTRRVSDLEAAVEVHRTMLKDLMHGQASAAGTSFNAAAFDAQMAEAILQQREKMALGAEEKAPAPVVQFILDPPEIPQEPM